MKNRIKAVIFDFDGTLTRPEGLDISEIKNELGCPDDSLILEFMEKLPEKEKAVFNTRLMELERRSAAKALPNPGADQVIARIKELGLKVGILTRNTKEAVTLSLENFPRLNTDAFHVIVTREDPVLPKPSPDSVRHTAALLGVCPEETLVVGDKVYDMDAGNHAGAITAFLTNGEPFWESVRSDFTISSLSELLPIVRKGIPLPTGKYPNELLDETVSSHLLFDDPSLLIHPGVGEDTAALDIQKEDTLILKTDPITFATDSIGHYAVLINANDIVTSGALPRWFLTTLLFPPGTTAWEIDMHIHELARTCKAWDITLCGGHTEITDAVTRPVVSGMLAGCVERNHLLDKKNIQKEDAILLTKGISIEGTSILAREMGELLLKKGMKPEELERCKEFIHHLSILPEAKIAARHPGVTAMHDVTEGGLATALEELSIAGAHQIELYTECIPVLPETRHVCKLLELDPMGLIGSGSLLITVSQPRAKELMQAILDAGIQVSQIGKMVQQGQGITAYDRGKPCAWPRFGVDEIARAFSVYG